MSRPPGATNNLLFEDRRGHPLAIHLGAPRKPPQTHRPVAEIISEYEGIGARECIRRHVQWLRQMGEIAEVPRCAR